MSVSNGQTGSAEVFNAAFVSKTAVTANSVTGKIDLANTDAESGDAITNVQKEINNKTFKPFTAEIISAAGTVTISTTLGLQRRKVLSDGGAVTASATPFGNSGGWVDATQIRLMGTDDINTVTIVHNDANYGCILNGNMTLSKFSNITLEWDEGELRWVEVARVG